MGMGVGVGALAVGMGNSTTCDLVLLCVSQRPMSFSGFVLFSLSQLGFSHPRPSSNYRRNSPGWCECVICQVPKIWLHHNSPRWHVSRFVGPYLLRTWGAKRQMVPLAWTRVASHRGLERPPDQASARSASPPPRPRTPQRYFLLFGIVSKIKK